MKVGKMCFPFQLGWFFLVHCWFSRVYRVGWITSIFMELIQPTQANLTQFLGSTVLVGKHIGKDATCIANMSLGKAWSSQRELPKQHFSRRRNQSMQLSKRPSTSEVKKEEAGREYERILMNGLDKNRQDQRWKRSSGKWCLSMTESLHILAMKFFVRRIRDAVFHSIWWCFAHRSFWGRQPLRGWLCKTEHAHCLSWGPHRCAGSASSSTPPTRSYIHLVAARWC